MACRVQTAVSATATGPAYSTPSSKNTQTNSSSESVLQKKIQTQNFNIYNINEEIIQTQI